MAAVAELLAADIASARHPDQPDASVAQAALAAVTRTADTGWLLTQVVP